MDEVLDCIVVGAGPAGLTAAIYLARFNLTLRVVDSGAGRCAMIPRTHNHAGFPGGVSGRELLERMRTQAAEFGVQVTDGRAHRLTRTAKGVFSLEREDGEPWSSRAVLLATGVVNNRPPIADEDHDVALRSGRLRYCPICDGFEVADQAVGVIGTAQHGHNEALFVRMYTRRVTLISPEGPHDLGDEARRSLAHAGVRVVDGPCGRLRLDGEDIVAPTAEGDLRFDAIYPALGSVIRSELALGLGAEATDDGCLVTDAKQRTSIPGLYAAGDVAKGLDQISHAMGEAGVAAIAIRNDLAEITPLLR